MIQAKEVEMENQNVSVVETQNPNSGKQKGVCKYFQRGLNCRFGNECKFSHDLKQSGDNTSPANTDTSKAARNEFKSRSEEPQTRLNNPKNRKSRAENEADKSSDRAVREKSGKMEDVRPNRGREERDRRKERYKKSDATKRGKKGKREYEIEEVLRDNRWVARTLEINKDETALAVELRPFDPEFPYDLQALRFALVIPVDYPATKEHQRAVEIHVANKQIPVGVKHNIKIGFDSFARKNMLLGLKSPGEEKRLAEMVEWLGNNMESMFAIKPASTIKFKSFSPKESINAGESKGQMQDAGDEKDKNSNEGEQTQGSIGDDMVQGSSAVGVKGIAEQVQVAIRKPAYVNSNRVVMARPTIRALTANEGMSEEEIRKVMRKTQLEQLERRFKGKLETIKEGDEGRDTVLRINLELTEQEVPVSIRELEIDLFIPSGYPQGQQQIVGNTPVVVPRMHIINTRFVGKEGKKAAWKPGPVREKVLRAVEDKFLESYKSQPSRTLLNSMNWLDRYFFEIIVKELEKLSKDEVDSLTGVESKSTHKNTAEDESLGESEYTQESGEDNASESEDGMAAGGDDFEWPERRGIEIKFGTTELGKVTMVTCSNLWIEVRCAKCKNGVEIKDIAPTYFNTPDRQVWIECGKCKSEIGVRFRAGWIHNASKSLGCLDVTNAVPMDLRPSTYDLTCEKCLLTTDEHGDAGLGEDDEGDAEVNKSDGNDNGDEEDNGSENENESESESDSDDELRPVTCSITLTPNINNQALCTKCHSRLSVLLGDLSFVKLADYNAYKKKNKQKGGKSKLGEEEIARRKQRRKAAGPVLQLGTPLQKKGTCKHYVRSYRWLRFPCCGKLYPCDTCHDIAEDHESQRAKLMVCGLCSKEQSVAKAEMLGVCINCKSKFVKKRADGSGPQRFWEGGMGVRDRAKMSRNDPHKYKGLGKTTSNKRSSK
ncbi:hypothetical protein AX774_g6830 [Zancudomyces culisetae]|uniref:CHY-type domain-containing protein n=1 Tax=Zancudomyces culisetae TaxID=1213189 RepID=A0A1R1PFL2_ZANCU|nr:hypothetical protein AX774_g6830 [Zancudomyces culisetae]|eukprot:OMH79747.1 hypothetical protein AX774_g6830 [Zancudomyces culisetae]